MMTGRRLGAICAALIGALVLSPRAEAAGACAAYFTAALPVPSGWAAMYDVFHAQHAPLATIDCTQAAIPLSVGVANDSTVLVYQTAYVLSSDMAATWTAVPLSGSAAPSGGWLPSLATGALGLSSGQLNAGWNFVSFLTARWNGSKWLIGCADAVCATSNWSLQAITRQSTLTVTLTPVSPSIPDDTPLGATVAAIACAWSDGSPCTATFSFGSPNNNAGGIYAISGSNVIVNSSGPGVGAAGSIENITVVATQ